MLREQQGRLAQHLVLLLRPHLVLPVVLFHELLLVQAHRSGLLAQNLSTLLFQRTQGLLALQVQHQTQHQLQQVVRPLVLQIQ